MNKTIVVLDFCKICELANVASINKDLVQRRPMRAVIGRNRVAEQLSGLEYKELNKILMVHWRDHMTSPTQAMANHITQKEAIKLKNTVIETNSTIDEIDVWKLQILDRLEHAKDDSDWAKIGKLYNDALKRRGENVLTLHKVTGVEKESDIQGAMLTKYYKTIADHLGQEKVSEMKQNAKKKISNRADYVIEEFIEKVEELESDEDE